jgi:hypothetical protein
VKKKRERKNDNGDERDNENNDGEIEVGKIHLRY